jgi:protein Mpv17
MLSRLKWLGTSPLFKFKSKYLSLLSKIITQQCIFAPIFGSYFFTAQTLLAGGGLSDVTDRLERTFFVTWLNSCKLWPMVTAINFTMISPQHRNVFAGKFLLQLVHPMISWILLAGIIGIGWQAYMSWLNQRAAVQATQDHSEVPAVTPGTI